MKAAEDDQLYGRFQSGESSAYDALVLKYMDRLVLYLEGLTHERMDAEDLAIETFAAILLKKPAIRPGGFQAYLYRAARNRATNLHFFRRRTAAFSLDDSQMEEALVARSKDPFLQSERRQAVLRCLNRLEPQSREALWLAYFEGLSYAQAAAVMGVSAKKVDNLLIKGKKWMRVELAREGITDANE